MGGLLFRRGQAMRIWAVAGAGFRNNGLIARPDAPEVPKARKTGSQEIIRVACG